MKAYGGEKLQLHAFFTLALGRDKWSASRPGRFVRKRIPNPHWMGFTTGLDDVERRRILWPCREIEPQFLGRLVRSLATILTELQDN
jgi:hypothetical protein